MRTSHFFNIEKIKKKQVSKITKQKNKHPKRQDFGLNDGPSYLARDQLKLALQNLSKLGIADQYIEILPDSHPGPDFFPEGLHIQLSFETPDVIIGNFAKDIGCGMAFGKTNSVSLSNEDEISEILKDTRHRLGGGNHFLEYQQVDWVIDEDSKIWKQIVNSDLGQSFHFKGIENMIMKNHIKKEGIIALLHSGADSFGENLQKWVFKTGKLKNKSYLCDSHEYLKRYEECLNHSIMKREEIFKKLKIELIQDSVHNQVKLHEDNSHSYYISANPVTKGSIFPIPASFGEYTLYVLATGISTALPHGAGRILRRYEAKSQKDAINAATSKRLENLRTKVICSSESRLLSESPDCYRTLKEISDKIIEANLIIPLFTAKPIKTFKV